MMPIDTQTARARFRKPTKPRTYWFTWRHIRCKVLLSPDRPWPGSMQLEFRAICARDVPVPITSSGYVAHMVGPETLSLAGGVEAYMRAWMDREAGTKAYRQAEQRWRQLELPLELAE